jgi:MerR family transcriptional regulator, light-induced transcriptional regulator
MSELGIGDLARRTGLTPQVIRAWETRFDFPQPRRTPSGRRTYDSSDVDRIARVLTLKQSGSRLAQAIARVVQQGDADGHDLSVYGELRRQLPHLESRLMRRDVLVAISRAIEDEALARAVRPLVFGAFQREDFYLQSAPHWQELARTAEGCVVFADFAEPLDAEARPVRVPLDADSPLLREWAVVVRSTAFSTVLTGWEVPGNGGHGDRQFETIFSLEPDAVRVAVETCLTAARSAGLPPEAILRDPAAADVGPPRTPSPGVDALVLRAFGYLQQLSTPDGRPG